MALRQRGWSGRLATLPLSGFFSCFFLPEHDYVTFGSLLSQIQPSSVCSLSSVCRSVTLVHPTRQLNLSIIFLHRCVPWPSSDVRTKFYGDGLRITPPSGALNARRLEKLSDFGPAMAISHERYKIRPRVQLLTNMKRHVINSLV